MKQLLWLAMLTASLLSGQALSSLQTLAGSDSIGDGGRAITALLRQVEGVAVDRAGYVYLADAADHRIRRISPGGVIETIAGDGTAGFSGDGGMSRQARLANPYGVAVDSFGRIYIADLGNARIRCIDTNGIIRTVAGGGSTEPSEFGGSALEIKLNSPRDVVVDRYDQLSFSDFGGHRVYTLTTAGTLAITAGTGTAGVPAENGIARRAALNSPGGLAVDVNGTLYVADSGNRAVRRIRRGLISTVAAGMRGDIPVPFNVPVGLALDGLGTLHVSDGTQVWHLTDTGSLTRSIAVGRGVAADGTGVVYLAASREVRRLQTNGIVAAFAGAGDPRYTAQGEAATTARLSRPRTVLADAAGNLYFTDQGSNRVLRIDPAGALTTVAGTGEAGYAGDGGPATDAKLSGPTGLALDPWGNVYVSDTGNHRVRRISRNGMIFTLAGTGEAGTSPDGIFGPFVRLDSPTGLTVDSLGNLYIADTGNHMVKRFSPGGIVTALAGTGRAGFTGDEGPAAAARLDSPQAVAADNEGNVYIADTGNDAIRLVTRSGRIQTVFDGAPPPWRGPQHLSLTIDGGLLLADTGQQRVVRVDRNGKITELAGAQQGLVWPSGVVQTPSGSLVIADAERRRLFLLAEKPSAEE